MTSGERPVPSAEPRGAGRDAMTGTRKVSSGTAWEPVVGYSRAVAAGDYIFVSGCTSVAGADFVHPGDAYAQTAQAIANVRTALESLGAGLSDVVRTRMFVTDISRFAEVARAHHEFFAAAPPASTLVEVRRLLLPAMLIEIEADAYRGSALGPKALERAKPKMAGKKKSASTSKHHR